MGKPITHWIKQIGNEFSDYLESIVISNDNNLYIIGSGFADNNPFILKTDSEGNEE